MPHYEEQGSQFYEYNAIIIVVAEGVKVSIEVHVQKCKDQTIVLGPYKCVGFPHPQPLNYYYEVFALLLKSKLIWLSFEPRRCCADVVFEEGDIMLAKLPLCVSI